jgi:DNA-binding NtrC family response regulator
MNLQVEEGVMRDEEGVMREPGYWALEPDVSSAADTDLTVLVSGDCDAAMSIAHSIHKRSRRRNGPFVTVNCRQLDASLMAALLGPPSAELPPALAFPFANGAQGGTLVLEEVGALNTALQTYLLGFLAPERLGRTNGTSRGGPDGMRVIATTSEWLVDRIGDGTFEADLFYRLNPIHLVLNDAFDG